MQIPMQDVTKKIFKAVFTAHDLQPESIREASKCQMFKNI